VYASNKKQVIEINKLKDFKNKLRKNRSLVVRLKNNVLLLDGSVISSFENATIIVNLPLKPLTNTIFGYTLRYIGFLKFIAIFRFIV
jgi:ribosomal protein L14